jgi:hypothetical protein
MASLAIGFDQLTFGERNGVSARRLVSWITLAHRFASRTCNARASPRHQPAALESASTLALALQPGCL